MKTSPPPLAQSFAGLAAAMGSMALARARRGEMAHALILATFAAMFGCLTVLAAAWEEGRLIATPTRRRTQARPASPRKQPAQAAPTPGLRPQPAHASCQRAIPHSAQAPRPRRPPRLPHPAHVPRPARHLLHVIEALRGLTPNHALIVPLS